MSEGLLGEALEGDDEKSEAEAPGGLSSAEAFALAIAAKLGGNDPQVARDTSAFLTKQTQLLEVQTAHLKDEHQARLHYLQGQASEVDIRRLGLRLRVGFQLFLALLAAMIGIAIALVIRDAVTSRSVVLDPFDIAPSVAEEVPSGKMIAAGLLDVLTRIQAANRSSVEHRSLSNAWTNEIAIEVPETGVSIGQLERALKARFAHDQHIEGDLVRAGPDGLALTVRGTGILPKTFTDPSHNLDRLLTAAGEYVYGQSQPGLWAAYLANNDRNDEAIRFAHEEYATIDPSERPYVLNYWANAAVGKGGPGAMREALSLYQESIRLKPDFWIGYNNVMFALAGLADEEGVVRVGHALARAAGGRPGRAGEEEYGNYDLTIWDLPAVRAGAVADMETHNGIGTTSGTEGLENLAIVQYEVQMHDTVAAALRLKTIRIDANNLPDVAQAALDRALLAEESGDLKSAAAQWDIFMAAYANPSISTSNPLLICYAAVTYERTGQPKRADAALDAAGTLKFVDCERFRGDVQDLRGDWAGAQATYARNVAHATSVPAGYYSWGVALAKHGDLDGAIAKLKAANERGPHWADPLKAWGDVLLKQGKAKEALAKYTEAVKYAPAWPALLAARDAAAAK